MGQAREIMDRLTEAILGHDWATAEGLYAEDAVAVTPDAGLIRGGAAIVGYLQAQADAFPDASYERIAGHEAGDVAVDEGFYGGTNTGALLMPDGTSLPATGRSMRVRSADIATVRDGKVVEHHFYFDQLEMLTQLGLMPEQQAA